MLRRRRRRKRRKLTLPLLMLLLLLMLMLLLFQGLTVSMAESAQQQSVYQNAFNKRNLNNNNAAQEKENENENAVEQRTDDDECVLLASSSGDFSCAQAALAKNSPLELYCATIAVAQTAARATTTFNSLLSVADNNNNINNVNNNNNNNNTENAITSNNNNNNNNFNANDDQDDDERQVCFCCTQTGAKRLLASNNFATAQNKANQASTISIANGYNFLLVALLCLIIIVTFVGNVLVCLSVIKVRKLRHPSNYLLISLAISDLCVSLFVMPFGLYVGINDYWYLGKALCNVYVSFDITSCTASILNLCVISIDRYLAITKPLTYGCKRTTRLMLALIAGIWICACCISIPPLLISGNEYGSVEAPICEPSQHLWYQLYATCISFYIPLVVMLCLYYNIYTAAKKVVEDEQRATVGLRLNSFKAPPPPIPQSLPQPPPLAACSLQAPQTLNNNVDANNNNQHLKSNFNQNINNNNNNNNNGNSLLSKSARALQSSTATTTSSSSITTTKSASNAAANLKKAKAKANNAGNQHSSSSSSKASSAMRERKASITLGIIMSAFTVCWLPFFCLALLRPFFEGINNLPRSVVSFTLWLGYANSMLNPIIYVTFHRDFRNAFKQLLCLQKPNVNAF